MKKNLLLVYIFSLCISTLFAADVAVLQADTSLKAESEKNYSINLGQKLHQWILSEGINSEIINESELRGYSIANKKVVILPYNGTQSRANFNVLSDFMDNGGKLIVFYSNDSKLASKMKLRLQGYISDSTAAKWQSMQVTGKYDIFPPIVHQNSKNILPAYPKHGSEVIFYWHDVNGKKNKEPAVVLTPYGFWITHVLLNGAGSNTLEQRQLLKAMLLHLGVGNEKQFKKDEVRELFQQYPLPPYSLTSEFSSGDSKKKVKELKEKQRMILKNIANSDALKNDINDYILNINKLYSSKYSPQDFQIRGIWDHFAMGLYPGNWKKTAGILAKAQITDVFLNAAWPTKVHYKSMTYPKSDIYNTHGDQIQQSLDALKKHNIKVHIWKVCWRFDDLKSQLRNSPDFKRRFQKDVHGNTIQWLCPSLKENVDWEIAQLQEIVKKYDVDGIHLDYIRFKNKDVCFCDNCRKGFEKAIGKKVEHWPQDVYSGSLKTQYQKFRVGLINSFVRKASKAVKDIKPYVKVSAAVYGGYPSCYFSIGQDWPLWVNQEYIDFVVPMNYFNTLAELNKYVSQQLQYVSRDKLVSGIGVSSGNSDLSSVETIQQLMLLKKKHLEGYVIFDLNKRVEQEIMPMLQ